MFLVNVIFPKETPTWLKIAQQTELYIASSLVLLLIDLQQLGTLGSRAFLVAWVDTPVLCVLMVYFGWRILKVHITDAIILCSTTLICGSSAAIAMTNALHLPKEKSELSIAISSLMTIPVIGFLPPLAMALGMNSYEAGAWFGGCVDSTGAVIATASVLDDNEVLSSSAIVKMIQNILIAPFSLVVVLLVVYFPNIVEGYIPLVPSKTANLDEKSSSSTAGSHPSINTSQKEVHNNAKLVAAGETLTCTKALSLLWERFPKFVLGFLVTAVLFSLTVPSDLHTVCQNTSFYLAEWFSTCSFVSIGMGLRLRTFPRSSHLVRFLVLYLLTQTLDIIVTAGLATTFH